MARKYLTLCAVAAALLVFPVVSASKLPLGATAAEAREEIVSVSFFYDALADEGCRRDPAQRRDLGQAHIEVDGAGQANCFFEPGVAVPRVDAVPRSRDKWTEHRGNRRRPRGLGRLARALVVVVLLEIVDQISPLRRLCPRRTAAPA